MEGKKEKMERREGCDVGMEGGRERGEGRGRKGRKEGGCSKRVEIGKVG